MNTLTFRLGALAFVVTTASVLFFAGCSGDDSTQTTPTPRDSGTDSTTKEDGGKSHKDGGSNGKDSATGDDSSEEAGDDASDANEEDAVSLETPDCGSDSSSCNSCYDDAQAAENPYNACSAYTKNCVPFTLTVPTHPAIP
jgi:hypothetical protein